jgi:hypothetical protein
VALLLPPPPAAPRSGSEEPAVATLTGAAASAWAGATVASEWSAAVCPTPALPASCTRRARACTSDAADTVTALPLPVEKEKADVPELGAAGAAAAGAKSVAPVAAAVWREGPDRAASALASSSSPSTARALASAAVDSTTGVPRPAMKNP